ncbi:hypothetical protein BHM03_00025705 [Ensete ventricosum]|nr:hypothetical protein BHM03_00025705 [Ensete ventricosum]
MLASGVPMEEEDLQKAVVAYLRKKGFTKTEIALQEEQQNRLSSSSHPDLPLSRYEDPSARSLFCYPTLFFILHLFYRDHTANQSLFDRLENDPVRYTGGYSKLRSWAYSSLDLYKYAYDLLLQYLQKTQSLTILGIINERINFEGTDSVDYQHILL